MKVIALYSIKGGVGKTTAAVNFSYLNAQDGKRTLVCDLDPQSSASFFFRIKPMKKQSSRMMVSGKDTASEFIRATDYENLDLLPSDNSFRKLDVRLDRANRSRKQLLNTFRQFEDDYETIFVDCPPSLTLLSENIFRASDVLLIPVIPSVLSRRTFEQALGFLKKKQISVKHVIPFFSMVDRRRKLHREQMDELWAAYPDFPQNFVPYRSEIEQMGQLRAPLPAVHPGSRNSQETRMLWQEILERISP